MSDSEGQQPDFEEMGPLDEQLAEADFSEVADLDEKPEKKKKGLFGRGKKKRKGKKAKEEAPVALEEEQPEEDSRDDDRPIDDGRPRKEPSRVFELLANAEPYTVMLGVALLAILIAIFCLWMELHDYGYDIGAKRSKQTAMVDSAAESPWTEPMAVASSFDQPVNDDFAAF